jgi:hypothetical protein
MAIDFLSILFLIAFVGALLLFILLPRYGPHYTSRLTCPNCKRIFNFHWIPGATITSIINRNRRTLKCPYCHVKTNYDVMSTRVRKSKNTPKVKQKA